MGRVSQTLPEKIIVTSSTTRVLTGTGATVRLHWFCKLLQQSTNVTFFIICSSQPSARSNINVCWDEFMKIATELWNSSSELLARSNQFTLLSSGENENLASDFKRTMQLTCVWCNKRRRLNNNFNPTTVSSDLVGGRGGGEGGCNKGYNNLHTHSLIQSNNSITCYCGGRGKEPGTAVIYAACCQHLGVESWQNISNHRKYLTCLMCLLLCKQ